MSAKISLDYFTYVCLSARFSLSPLLQSLRLAPSSLSLSACLISLWEIPFFPLFPIIHFRLFLRLSFSLDISPREESLSQKYLEIFPLFFISSISIVSSSFFLSLSSRLLELARTSLSFRDRCHAANRTVRRFRSKHDNRAWARSMFTLFVIDRSFVHPSSLPYRGKFAKLFRGSHEVSFCLRRPRYICFSFLSRFRYLLLCFVILSSSSRCVRLFTQWVVEIIVYNVCSKYTRNILIFPREFDSYDRFSKIKTDCFLIKIWR